MTWIKMSTSAWVRFTWRRVGGITAALLAALGGGQEGAGQATFSDRPEALQAGAMLPRLRVEGNRIVNEAGARVVLRGLALSDPAHLREQGQWGRKYFERAASWKANVVRVPVHPSFWRGREREYLEMLDESVQWSGELGMYVIVDWHIIGNVLTGVYHRDIYVTSREETFRFWHTIAERYRGNPVVAMLELYNEPTDHEGRLGRMPWGEYKALIEELIFMIYAIDNRYIPLVAGPEWGYSLQPVREEPIAHPGVAYVTHPYPQKRNPPWEAQWEADWGFAAEKYPVVATEFGFMSAADRGAHNPVVGDETYGEALIRFFEERGISWTPWVFDPHWSPQLIRDWEYTPTRQGAFFKRKMEELNR